MEADKDRLTQFADELDKEADALERLITSVSGRPIAATHQQVQQVQQQQSAATLAPHQVPNKND